MQPGDLFLDYCVKRKKRENLDCWYKKKCEKCIRNWINRHCQLKQFFKDNPLQTTEKTVQPGGRDYGN